MEKGTKHDAGLCCIPEDADLPLHPSANQQAHLEAIHCGHAPPSPKAKAALLCLEQSQGCQEDAVEEQV